MTRICLIRYIKSMESAFEIIAEPNRRAILSLLLSSEQSVGEIERQLRMTQPTVSKHLRVLREAGFVESMVDAQRRLYRLRPERFQEVDSWLAQFRRFWLAHVDALERHLDRIDPDSRDRSTANSTSHSSAANSSTSLSKREPLTSNPSTSKKLTSSKKKGRKTTRPNRERNKGETK